jgi:tetratricopeptide (TPR) repeat protein
MFSLRYTVSVALLGALSAIPAVSAAGGFTNPVWVQQFVDARKVCRMGNLQEAERIYNDLLAVMKERNAAPSLIARAYDELAVVLKVTGRFDEAEKDYLRALTLMEQEDGHTGDRVGLLLSHVGAFYVETGQLARAEQYLFDSRDMLAGSKTIPAFCKASILQDLASLAFRRGQYEQSEKDFREALNVLRSGTPEDRPQLAIVLGDLAHVLTNQGKSKEARPLLNEAISIFQSVPGQFLPSYYGVMVINVGVARAEGDMHTAASSCDRALNLGQQVFGDDNIKLLPALDACSSVYKSQHRGKEGKALANRSTALKIEIASRSTAVGKTVDVSTLMKESPR